MRFSDLIKKHNDTKEQVKKQAPLPPFKAFLRSLSAIFTPIIPALIACGLITSALNIALYKYPLLAGEPLYQLFAVVGNTAFWCLHIFVGFNTAKEFDGTPVLGGILGALISHPHLAAIVLNGYPLTPGRGGVIAVLMVAALGAILEKQLRKIIPETLNLLLTPLLTYLIASAFAMFFLQPLAGFIATFIANASVGTLHKGSLLSGFVLSGSFLPMVILGLHQALSPIHLELVSRYGVTLLLPILAMAGAGQVGASLAVYVKTRNHQLKKTILSALPVGILGIGEPLIYGVTLPLGRPFIAACLGGAIGGAYQSYHLVGAATSGISGLPLVLATNKVTDYLLGLFIAYMAGFLAAWIIGFDDLTEASKTSKGTLLEEDPGKGP